MLNVRFVAVALFLVLSGIASAAYAQTRAYNVNPNATREILINASEDFTFKAVGGENTDLDFRLVGPTGRMELEDADPTSWTEGRIAVSRPGVYRLFVQNVGDEQNAVTLTLQ